MFTKITTTITTLIDLDTFKPDHSVTVDAEDDIPVSVIKAAVQGACQATINSLGGMTEQVDVEDGD